MTPLTPAPSSSQKHLTPVIPEPIRFEPLDSKQYHSQVTWSHGRHEAPPFLRHFKGPLGVSARKMRRQTWQGWSSYGEVGALARSAGREEKTEEIVAMAVATPQSHHSQLCHAMRQCLCHVTWMDAIPNASLVPSSPDSPPPVSHRVTSHLTRGPYSRAVRPAIRHWTDDPSHQHVTS